MQQKHVKAAISTELSIASAWKSGPEPGLRCKSGYLCTQRVRNENLIKSHILYVKYRIHNIT